MTKTKIWIIVATILSVLGILIFVIAMTLNNWNFGGLSTTKLVTNTHEVNEEFSDIFISVNTADIEILPSENDKTRVICTEEVKLLHSVSVNNGVLEISVKDTRKWYDHISLFSFENSKIILYLPEGEYGRLKVRGSTGDLFAAKNFTFSGVDALLSTGDTKLLCSAKELIEIEADTGDITIEDISAGELALTVSTGDIAVTNAAVTQDIEINVSTGEAKLQNTTCKSFSSDGSTGDITLENLVASEKLEIERSTGNIILKSSDAQEVDIETDTGDVRGSFKTDKIIFAKTNTGRVDVPKSTSGGRCEIETDTGDIKIEIK